VLDLETHPQSLCKPVCSARAGCPLKYHSCVAHPPPPAWQLPAVNSRLGMRSMGSSSTACAVASLLFSSSALLQLRIVGPIMCALCNRDVDYCSTLTHNRTPFRWPPRRLLKSVLTASHRTHALEPNLSLSPGKTRIHITPNFTASPRVYASSLLRLQGRVTCPSAARYIRIGRRPPSRRSRPRRPTQPITRPTTLRPRRLARHDPPGSVRSPGPQESE